MKIFDTKKKDKNTNFDPGLFLLVTGALANITIWIGAFVAAETDGRISVWVREWLLPILGGVSGLAMGITVTAGLVYVLARLSRIKPQIEQKFRVKKDQVKYRMVPNTRFYTAWGAIGLLLIISPALLAPYVFMVISGSTNLYAVLGDSWARIWSVGRIVAADLALGAVALVHGVQLPAVAGAGRAPKTSHTPKKSEGAARTPKATSGSAKELRECDVPGCDVSYRWPQGKGAHYKQFHKDLVVRKGIPAKVSLPLQEKES